MDLVHRYSASRRNKTATACCRLHKRAGPDAREDGDRASPLDRQGEETVEGEGQGHRHSGGGGGDDEPTVLRAVDSHNLMVGVAGEERRLADRAVPAVDNGPPAGGISPPAVDNGPAEHTDPNNPHNPNLADSWSSRPIPPLKTRHKA